VPDCRCRIGSGNLISHVVLDQGEGQRRRESPFFRGGTGHVAEVAQLGLGPYGFRRDSSVQVRRKGNRYPL
jgi:hypothetical protein